MIRHKRMSLSRRRFLGGSLAAGAALGFGLSAPTRLSSARRSEIRSRDWHTLPRNDGRTIEAGPRDLGGDLQLLRNSDGSFDLARTFVSAVQPTAGRFNMVGMRWVADLPPGTALAVEVRSSQDGVAWSGWAPVGHIMEGRESQPNPVADETFSDAVELGRASVMQYRLTLSTSDPRVSPTVQRVTATQIDALDAPTLADLDARGQAIPFRVGNGGPPTARLILRDGPNGWGPGVVPPELYWEPYSGLYPFQFVTIHHTAGVNNPENPVATVRAIWYYHAITLGWGDIGYHFLVDQYGNIYQGRDGGDATEGGHVFRYNHYNCGVSLLGQFHPGAPDVPPGGEPTPAALESAMRLAAFEAAYHQFDPREQHTYPKPPDWCRPQLVNYRVCGHRDWGRDGSCVATVCPGDNVYSHLPAIREQAAALIPSIRDFHLMAILNHQ